MNGRSSPRRGTEPLLATRRRVSGRKKRTKSRAENPKMKRNQKMAWKPKYSVMMPPMTGPMDWPSMRTAVCQRCRIKGLFDTR